MVKKSFRKLHLWLSLPFGMVITLICFSGAMLVFEKEIMEISKPQLYFVKAVGDKKLPIKELVERVSATLPDSVQVTGITVFSNPERTCRVNLSKPRHASMYVDAYSGEITGQYERIPFFAAMFKMHRWMLGSARAPDGSIGWGKLIVGISTLVLVAVLISGVVVWWPRNKCALKYRLSVNVKKGWRKFLYDLHVAGGMYVLVFLLAMALTGLTWSFQWYRNLFYTAFGVEPPQQERRHNLSLNTQARKGSKPDKNQETTYLHWQKVYDVLASQNPDFEQISISNGTANVSFGHWGNQRASDKYTFMPHSGEITSASLYRDAPNSDKIRGWIYSVHVGSWGGLLTRLLTFLAALFGASLPLTGYYLWLKKMRSSGEKRLPKHFHET